MIVRLTKSNQIMEIDMVKYLKDMICDDDFGVVTSETKIVFCNNTKEVFSIRSYEKDKLLEHYNSDYEIRKNFINNKLCGLKDIYNVISSELYDKGKVSIPI